MNICQSKKNTVKQNKRSWEEDESQYRILEDVKNLTFREGKDELNYIIEDHLKLYSTREL